MDASRHPDLGIDTTAELGAEIDLTSTPGRPDLHDAAQRERVEQQLTNIPDVLAARLVPGYDRDVDELHVVTTPNRGPKATVRDVQTVLLARCGVDIDHRVISVVQVEERQVLHTPNRVQLARVATVRAGHGLVADVTLTMGERETQGSAEGAATSGGHARTVARATLNAFTQLLDAPLGIELRDAAVVAIGGQEIAITLLELRDARGEEFRSGTALVRDPAADAIARSVLDALNRTIGDQGA